MRTLKKTLCLILCLAMMVGLCAIGASAVTFNDYKDKDKIQYEEAVTLLTALKVLEGDEKGFRPQDELTRAEGAAIMTRLLTKVTPTGVSSFTDMAGYTWAQPYVKFCEDKGIIAGYGNGKFGPGDKLTTSQFAKMLIVALGYDPIKEKMVNDAAWEINTTRKVTSLALANGLSAYLPGKNIQREQAAQLAYNTLFQTMVMPDGQSLEISWIGNLLRGGDAVVTVKEGTPIPNTAYDYNTNNNIDNVMQFCEAAFPELKLRTADDVYAVPTNYWFQGKDAQDKSYSAKKLLCTTIAVPVLARYAEDIDSVYGATLYNDAGFGYAEGYIELFENGENPLGDGYALKVTAKDYLTWLGVYAGAEGLLLDMTDYYAGTEVEDYQLTRLVIKYPYLAQVINVVPGENRTVTLKVFRDFGKAITVSVPCPDYKKGDMVLVYDAGCVDTTKAYATSTFERSVIELKPADAKNGTLQTVTLTKDAVGLATSLTVGGDVLPIGADDFATLGPDPASTEYGVAAPKGLWNIGFGLTAYMANGFVLGVVPDAVTYGDYIFVATAGDPDYHDAWGVTTSVGYVKQDATKVTTKVYGDSVDLLYWTTVDAGTYSDFAPFKDVEAVNVVTNIDGLKHDQPDIADLGDYKLTADSQTNILLWNTARNSFTLVKGIHNVKDWSGAGIAYALVPSQGAHAVAIVVDVTNMIPDEPIPEADPIYLLGQYPGTKTSDDGKVVYTYLAIVDGKITELMSKAPNSDLEKEGLVIPTYDGKYVKSVEKVTPENHPEYLTLDAQNTTVTFLNDTITVGDITYAVAKDAVAYIYNRNTGKLTVATPDVLPGLPAANVTLVATAKDKTVHTVYYVYPSKAI